jgi:hypothetical protein
MLSNVMLSVIHSGCHKLGLYDECRYARCRYAGVMVPDICPQMNWDGSELKWQTL